MPATVEYSDTFRALGRFLEMIGATNDMDIAEDAGNIEISWRKGDGERGQRQFQAYEMEAMCTTARLFRGLEGGSQRYTTSELLRILGDHLDEAEAERAIISEREGIFTVRARTKQGEFKRSFLRSDLVTRANENHQRRLVEQASPKPPRVA